ncbi:ExeA family protein [Desulfuromonas thiophila]|uniref:MSHA biogenesis protein MshM n=1 Tax=Desulfuromonas thiophila TaxID=57664 RepID=A0A1G6ZKP2_9BACT|nr:AAA family ATPase [Desulfuromonas thiophila]SDE02973.1 MSHA biogenesis protein MshM [Desulfuromonas thiophila]
MAQAAAARLCYGDHFGLREAPFALTPDTGFYYQTLSSQEALNVLLVALSHDEGLVKISGEVGTGKTLLCRKLLAELEADGRVTTAYLPNPLLTPAQLYASVASELGLPAGDGQAAGLVEALQQHLIALRAAGQRVVVCVDEAQSMPDASLEALRLLSNVETEKRKLLQIVLFAQPELDERLAGKALRQLRQRIGFSYVLQPMDYPTFCGYVRHRLHLAGQRGAALFRPAALRLLFRASGGVPRLVNILAHKALLASYGAGLTQVGRRQALAAIVDTEGVRRPLPLWQCLVLLLAVVLLCGLCFWAGQCLRGSL